MKNYVKICGFAVFCVLGCSADYDVVDDYYEQQYSELMENRACYGIVDFPEAFKLDSVSVYELDSSFKKIKKIKDVEVTAKNDGNSKFEVGRRDYTSPIIRVVASGTWKDADSVDVAIEFEKIVNIISGGYNIYVRLFDHLLVPRIKELTKIGYPFVAAQEKAEQELYSIYGVGVNSPDKDFLYELFKFSNSDSGFVENIENFRNDFVDGSWMDYRDRIKTADYLTQNWQSFSSDDLRYYGQVQMGSYGIPIDSHSGETFVIEDSTSAFYKDSLVCAGYGRASWRRDDGGYDTYAHNILRPFTALEREIGACVFDSLKWVNKDTTVVEFEGETYKCSHQLDSSVPTKPDFENWKKVKSRK